MASKDVIMLTILIFSGFYEIVKILNLQKISRKRFSSDNFNGRGQVHGRSQVQLLHDLQKKSFFKLKKNFKRFKIS